MVSYGRSIHMGQGLVDMAHQFKTAPLDKTGKLISIMLASLAVYSVIWDWGAGLFVLLWFIPYLFSPRGYTVSSKGIVIRTPVTSHIIPKDEIKSIETIGRVKTGAGITWQAGLFGYAGLCALKDGTTARVYATSCERMVRIQTTSGDPYLLSPAEPEIFQENCREVLEICK